MELELARELMKYFFYAPHANGILVFEDNEYLGVVLKKDVEYGITSGNFKLFENINILKVNELSTLLFRESSKKNAKVPVIDKAGNLIRIISYEEFISQFYFDEFVKNFKSGAFLDNLDYPLVITNCFKKCLYANKMAFNLAEFDFLGKSINLLLKKFEIKKIDRGLVLENKKDRFTLFISKSENKNFLYYVYNFLKLD
jgi:hypothetical protein